MQSYYDEKLTLLNKSVIVRQLAQPMYHIGHTEIFAKAPWYKVFLSWFKFKCSSKKKKVEKPVAEPTPIPASVHTFSSFSGADCVVYIDDKVIGELQEIEWYAPTKTESRKLGISNYYDKDLALEYPIVIRAMFAMFSSSAEIKELDNATIKIRFMNEYGQGMEREIRGVKTLREMSGISVDSILLESTHILIAKDITPYTPVKPLEEEYRVQWE